MRVLGARRLPLVQAVLPVRRSPHHRMSFYLFLPTLSSSAELFLVVSGFCGSCKLSVYPPKIAGFLSRTLYSASCCHNSNLTIASLVSTDILYVIPFSFALFPVGHKLGVPDVSDKLRGTFRKYIYSALTSVSLFSALTRIVQI